MFRLVTSAFLCLLVLPVNADDVRVERFISVFSSGENVTNAIYSELEYSGIESEELYGIIEQQLLDIYLRTDGESVERAAWLAKALSYSGDEKYRSTLRKVINSNAKGKVIRHTEKALERLSSYRTWNKDLNQDIEGLTGRMLYRKQTYNMLDSTNAHLRMIGAKRVWFSHPNDSEFIAHLSERLEELYNQSALTTREVDALGWFCNVLGKSADSQYRTQLEVVSKEASNKRVRKYAKKNLKKL